MIRPVNVVANAHSRAPPTLHSSPHQPQILHIDIHLFITHHLECRDRKAEAWTALDWTLCRPLAAAPSPRRHFPETRHQRHPSQHAKLSRPKQDKMKRERSFTGDLWTACIASSFGPRLANDNDEMMVALASRTEGGEHEEEKRKLSGQSNEALVTSVQLPGWLGTWRGPTAVTIRRCGANSQTL